jgi:hypothetical protein
MTKATVPELSLTQLHTLQRVLNEWNNSRLAHTWKSLTYIGTKRFRAGQTWNMHTVVKDTLEDPTRNEALLNTRLNDSLICWPTFVIAAQQTMPTRGRRYTTTTGTVAALQALTHRLIYIV